MSKIFYKSIAVLALAITMSVPVMAEAPKPVEPPKVLSVKEVIALYAERYNVSYEQMYRTSFCESSLNPNAINSTDREYSVGIAQINLKAHTHITVEQAKDIYFSAEFMAKEFARGNAKIWSCYNKIY